MKIRWSQNSIRLRITPGELAALQKGEAVVETLELPGGNWTTKLVVEAATSLAMNGGTVHIALSALDFERLASPENEGVYFGGDEQSALRYFIEKDFPCAHPRAIDALEPASETFEPTAEFVERSRGKC